MTDPSVGAASDRELSALCALYTAQRADGSAIYTVSIQLIGIMVAYAAVGFAVLGSTVLAKQEWVRAFIAVPLWGLSAYVVVNGRVHAERSRAIGELERIIVQQLPMPLRPSTLNPRRDLGVTALWKQPEFVAITLLSYAAAFSGVLGLSVYTVWATARVDALAAALSGGLYIFAASLIVVVGLSRR